MFKTPQKGTDSVEGMKKRLYFKRSDLTNSLQKQGKANFWMP